ncbi:MAG: zinc-dependent alcohol dehydrogenase family protein [Pseudolabrys sp.]
MQAIIFNRAGEPADVLQHADVALPVPNDNQVLVQVVARPIHPADLAFIRGQYRIRPQFPQVAGLEGAGVVVKSPANAPFPAGTRVGFRYPGSWAEYAAVPFDRLTEVPADIPDDVACQFSLNPITAWALLDEAKVKAGDWILLTAAASTVSNLITAMAKRRGVRVIGVVRDGRARSLANHVFSINEPDLPGALSAIAGDRRIAALLDSVGGPNTQKLFAALAPGARIIAYGVQDREPAAVTNAMLVYSNLTWIGFGIDRWLSGFPGDQKASMVRDLWSMLRDNTLTLPIASKHSLAQFRNALAADSHSARTGKVLLV